MTAIVLRGNAMNLPIPDNTVDLIVTSPPYFALRDYRDAGASLAGQVGSEATPAAFVDALICATREMVRVLKPSGSIFVNLGDKYAGGGQGGNVGGNLNGGPHLNRTTAAARVVPVGIPNKSLMGLPWRYALRCIDDLGLILRAEVIWDKPNGLPESVTDRVRRSHEQWFHMTREPRYYSAVDEIREAHLHGGTGATWEQRKAAGQSMRHGDTGGGASEGAPGPKQGNPVGKLPGSVWTVPTAPLVVPDHLAVDHFAAFPPEWPKRLILGWSPPGGVIADPFSGTGTTVMVASALGRTGIGVDLSADYCRLAQWRTADLAQQAKVRDELFRKPEPVADGQTSLFEGVL